MLTLNDDSSPDESKLPVNRTPIEKFIIVWEAVKRSLLSAEILLKSTYAELDGIARDIDAGTKIEHRAAAPLISCLGFIDFAFRFKSLMDSLPMVNAKRPEMVQLQKALESVEEARHHLQHLRRELSTNDAVAYPILGSISWLTGDSAYAMAMGTPIGKTEFPSLSYDKEERKWTAKHVFMARDAVVDLDATIQEMRTAYNFIAAALKSPQPDAPEFKALKELKWGETYAMKMEIKHFGEGE